MIVKRLPKPLRLFLYVSLALVATAPIYILMPRPPRTPSAVQNLAEMESFLERLVQSKNPPGLSVAVVKNGQIVYDRAFGLADGPGGLAATPETVYHWWSMTKIPTAVAILQLYEQGRLNLDAPVKVYLPWFEVQYPSARSTPITVRQLLNHSSGLRDSMPDMMGWLHFDDATRDQTELAKRYLPRYNRLQFEPGSRSKYTNFGYMVLGAVIESVTGQSYETHITSSILKPLGMERTGFVYPANAQSYEAVGSLPMVHLYTPLLPFFTEMDEIIREQKSGVFWLRRLYVDATPPTGLIGPAADVAKLMMMYLNEGELNSHRLLKPETARLMRIAEQGREHGLGWFVKSEGSRLQLEHAGGGPGFATVMRVYPREGLGIVVLANGTDLDRKNLVDLLASLNW